MALKHVKSLAEMRKQIQSAIMLVDEALRSDNLIERNLRRMLADPSPNASDITTILNAAEANDTTQKLTYRIRDLLNTDNFVFISKSVFSPRADVGEYWTLDNTLDQKGTIVDPDYIGYGSLLYLQALDVIQIESTQNPAIDGLYVVESAVTGVGGLPRTITLTTEFPLAAPSNDSTIQITLVERDV